MQVFSRFRVFTVALILALGAWGTLGSAGPAVAAPPEPVAGLDPGLAGEQGTVDVVVSAVDGQEAQAAERIRALGGTVGEDVALVDGMTATVPADRAEEIASSPEVAAVTEDRPVRFLQDGAAVDPSVASPYRDVTGATAMHSQGLTGDGVGVALIDTGVAAVADLQGQVAGGIDLSGEGTLSDGHGHGTAMAGLIVGTGHDDPARTGMAPGAHLVVAKVAGADGVTSMSRMLKAMSWVAANRRRYNIRVVNISFGVAATQDPFADPLILGVEKLRSLGIVVVAAAGNDGPEKGTVNSPGSGPTVLTVGALDDRGNTEPADDEVAPWSSQGPTAAGFAKPDVVAPGEHVVSTVSPDSTIATTYPNALIPPSYIRGGGSSQATAVTSGGVALLLQARPRLTPDQVKHAVHSAADPVAGVDADAQGSGRLDVPGAAAADSGPRRAARAGFASASDACRKGDEACGAWDGARWRGLRWRDKDWAGARWRGLRWRDQDWAGARWRSVWDGARWRYVVWDGSRWRGSRWREATWDGSRWREATWDGSRWREATWDGSRWREATWDGSRWREASWDGSRWRSDWSSG